MQGENEVVQDVERVEVTPADGGDVILPEGTVQADPDAAAAAEVDPENDPADLSPDGRAETVVHSQPATEVIPEGQAGAQAPAAPAADPTNPFGLKRLPDETPREFALRLELAKTRSQVRTQRTGELMETIRPGAPAPKGPGQLSEAAQAVLSKYKPEELAALRDVMPALAEELGFVRKDDIEGSTYADKAQEQLDTFLEKHPEYAPEKDQEGVLWDRFKSEFGLYKQPSNPRDYARIFEKVHQTVFGIQSGGAVLPKVQAQQKKIQVASHAGASGPSSSQRQMRPGSNAGAGLRLDALKGFSDEEKAGIAARAGGEA